MDSNLCIKFSFAVPAGKEHFLNKANLIIEEVNKVIIGKEKVIRKVWMTILSGGHVLLEDVPGVGKDNDGAGFFKGFGTFLSKNTVYTGRHAIGCGRFLLL